MVFSNKLKPSEWLPFVEGAALEHRYAEHALESWMIGVWTVDKSKWNQDYSPQLSVPRHVGWMNTLPGGDESKPNLYDFFNYQGKADNFVSQAIGKAGKPKLHVNHWRTYTAALMNQDVVHLALNLVFLQWVRSMASLIHCDQNNIHSATYAPYQKTLRAIEHYKEVFADENKFYDSLRFGRDIKNNNIDLTESTLIRHFDLDMHDRVKRFPLIVEKLQEECSSLLPWISGESSDMDISSFSLV